MSQTQPRLSPLATGLRCKCPRCGKGPLLKGFLTIRKECPACGLDYAFADPADGPAFFAMSGVGLAVMAMFLVVEVLYRPPPTFHFLVTLPLTAVGCLAVLRPIKGWLVSSQYFYRAEEAKWDSPGKHGPF
ncbi:MAG TPA: DUF983 domain-containing protein [Caulobacteraceae bacterium]|nr:DUF983 domain-containing protein [Caulobacteraceae bacterium]